MCLFTLLKKNCRYKYGKVQIQNSGRGQNAIPIKGNEALLNTAVTRFYSREKERLWVRSRFEEEIYGTWISKLFENTIFMVDMYENRYMWRMKGQVSQEWIKIKLSLHCTLHLTLYCSTLHWANIQRTLASLADHTYNHRTPFLDWAFVETHPYDF